MLAIERQTRQKKLNELIKRLALALLDEENQTDIESVVLELKDIYKDYFRHSYSDFFPLLLEIRDDGNCDVEYLTNNLNTISKCIERAYSDGKTENNFLYKPVLKLCDHINLELARLSNSSNLELQVRASAHQLEIAKDSLLSAQKQVEAATKSADAATEKASSLQTEILTVLSIFSAVVLAFMGGMSFTGSTLESINKASIYKVSFVAIICGFVVFNTICGLMYIIAKITGRNIYTVCNKPNCSCSEPTSTCSSIRRLKLRLPYVFWVDAILLGLLGLVTLAWAIDLHQAVTWLRNFFL